MVKPFGDDPAGGAYSAIFTTYFLQQVLCRFIQSTDIDCIQLCLVAVW